MSIIVENITKIFGNQKALDNVSFKINAGEIVGLVGPNGAGKSTMMRIITCYLPQTSGNVSVCDFDIVNASIKIRKKIGYLPEQNPLYLDMYIYEYLELMAGIHRLENKTKERIAQMIDITGLNAERKKKIGSLSKGFRQRVGLAQALIHNPEVLILDEPTSGLDPNQIIEIRNLIKTIGKEKTVLFSSHIMQEVEAVCDKVLIIDKGRIVADETTDKIHNINTEFQLISVEFDSVVNKKMLEEIPGLIDVMPIKEKIWSIKAETHKDIRPEIFKFAVRNNITVLSMNIEEKSLEEIFHQLTKNNYTES